MTAASKYGVNVDTITTNRDFETLKGNNKVAILKNIALKIEVFNSTE